MSPNSYKAVPVSVPTCTGELPAWTTAAVAATALVIATAVWGVPRTNFHSVAIGSIGDVWRAYLA